MSALGAMTENVARITSAPSPLPSTVVATPEVQPEPRNDNADAGRYRLTIEAVYCLGLCACAPAALLDEAPIGRLNDASPDELAHEVGA